MAPGLPQEYRAGAVSEPLDDDELREALRAAGGLLTRAELARLWGVSYTRVVQITSTPNFPAPLTVSQGAQRWTGRAIARWSADNDRPQPPVPAEDD